MTINDGTHLFFDASCLIAAAGSPTGGSGFLLSLIARGFLRGAVSHPVLVEAERNVRIKLGSEAVETYHRLLENTPLLLARVPPLSPAPAALESVSQKDHHVVAAAMAANAPFLLTLDRPLKAQVNQAGLSLAAYEPGDFIKLVLPRHAQYQALR